MRTLELGHFIAATFSFRACWATSMPRRRRPAEGLSGPRDHAGPGLRPEGAGSRSGRLRCHRRTSGDLRCLTNHSASETDMLPARAGISIGDTFAGIFACLCVFAELIRTSRQKQSANGGTVDVALTDSLVSLMERLLPKYPSFPRLAICRTVLAEHPRLWHLPNSCLRSSALCCSGQGRDGFAAVAQG